MDFELASKYIRDRLKNELSPNLCYHSYNHTVDVYDATVKLAKLEGLDEESLGLVKIAALYHDAGFIVQYLNNEKVAAQMVRETLPQFGYTPSQINVVADIILATVVTETPKNHLQQIVKDADLDYLGRDDFHSISLSLKKELNSNGFHLTDRSWDEIQISFFEKHLYYTPSAIALRQENKQKHCEEIKKRLLSYGKK